MTATLEAENETTATVTTVTTVTAPAGSMLAVLKALASHASPVERYPASRSYVMTHIHIRSVGRIGRPSLIATNGITLAEFHADAGSEWKVEGPDVIIPAADVLKAAKSVLKTKRGHDALPATIAVDLVSSRWSIVGPDVLNTAGGPILDIGAKFPPTDNVHAPIAWPNDTVRLACSKLSACAESAEAIGSTGMDVDSMKPGGVSAFSADGCGGRLVMLLMSMTLPKQAAKKEAERMATSAEPR